MISDQVISELKKLSNPNPKDLEGMKRFGINTENSLCISMKPLDELGKRICKEPKEVRHQLALEIWETGIREARILAGRIDVPELVMADQMESWVKDFNSWDVCDNTIMKDFSYSKLGWEKAIPWSKSEDEFVKRAGFVLMAMLAMHDKLAKDEDFYPFLQRIKEEATDERNFVKKAVNWALRQIGKSRTKNLYNLALETANEILDLAPACPQPFTTPRHPDVRKDPGLDSSVPQNDGEKIPGLPARPGGRSGGRPGMTPEGAKTARWIAKDAIRELSTSKYVLKKFGEE